MNLESLLSALEHPPTAPTPGAAAPPSDITVNEEQEWLEQIEAIYTKRLPAVFPNWESRPQQIDMAKKVWLGLMRQTGALVEAGTGTGKSQGHLGPAVEYARDNGAPVIISTGTHVLQEQYLTKDVPVLQRAIGHFDVVLAKGKANYLCLKRLAEETNQLTLGDDPIDEIAEWSETTATGDRAELPGHLAAVWDRVCVDDNCIGASCPFFDDCFYYKARRSMAKASIIIANHALLMADIAAREASAGNASVLPDPCAIIIDEAHHLETTARESLGVQLGQTRLSRLLADIRRKVPTMDQTIMAACVMAHDTMFADLAATLTEDRGELAIGTAHTALLDMLSELRKELRRESEKAATDQLKSDIEKLIERVDRYRADLSMLAEPGNEYVVWAERTAGGSNITIHATPVDVTRPLRAHLWGRCPVVCSSATLTTNRDFNYFRRSTGAPADAIGFITESPFDYQRQALLYVPMDLPDPKAPDFHAQLADKIEAILQASRGRAFVLSTSYRGMQDLYARIAPKLPYTCYYQGQMSRQELLERFREDVHSVLFATASFWEGVDVQGQALSCVIIDRLPFAVPTDPVTQAKVKAIEAAGGNAFADYSLPEAVLRLRQGFGRLIRSQSDRGVVAILDRRLLQARYGRVFLNSLPPARLTRRIEDVQRFFAEEVGVA